jgi:NADH:ubiquinone oxidoreductase subunit E
MNDRIKELAEQVGSTHKQNLGVYQFYTDELEKFAELIVKECAKVSEDDITDGDACCTNTAYRIASQIKKHFGVEE